VGGGGVRRCCCCCAAPALVWPPPPLLLLLLLRRPRTFAGREQRAARDGPRQRALQVLQLRVRAAVARQVDHEPVQLPQRQGDAICGRGAASASAFEAGAGGGTGRASAPRCPTTQAARAPPPGGLVVGHGRAIAPLTHPWRRRTPPAPRSPASCAFADHPALPAPAGVPPAVSSSLQRPSCHWPSPGRGGRLIRPWGRVGGPRSLGGGWGAPVGLAGAGRQRL
jgi:hypothetical protein